METLHELIPFVKDMLSQRSGRGLLKVYLVGTAVAVVGTVLGLVETVCQPFTGGYVQDAEMAMLMLERPRGTRVAGLPVKKRRARRVEEEEVRGETYFPKVPQTHGQHVHRIAANRLHAS